MYEITALYHPDFQLDTKAGASPVEKLVAEYKGTVSSVQIWGNKKMAYIIVGQTSANYACYTVDIAGDVLIKLEQRLNIAEEVIRYLVVKVDKKAKAFAEQQASGDGDKEGERTDG